jgi:broad specificity phosphatase PhoE
MAIVVIVRHGQSESNAANIIAGRQYNPGLTEKGVIQAHQLGKYLSNEYADTFSSMIISGMLRTNETANIINQHLNINPDKIFYDAELKEKDFGELEGQIHVRPSIHRQLGYNESIPGGESNAIFVPRVTEAVCHYLNSPESLILIVAHGYVIEMVTEALLGEPQHKKNCEFAIIDPAEITNFIGKCGVVIEDIGIFDL